MAVGNLELIKSQSLTSSASTFSVTDCFNANYDVYMINIDSFDQATANTYLNMRLLDSGGSVISASEYDFAELQMTAYTAFQENRNTGQTVMFDRLNFNTNGVTGVGINIYIFNPYDSSSYTFGKFQSMGIVSSGGIGFKGIGVHKSAEQITGLNFFLDTGNIDSATVNVYGVK